MPDEKELEKLECLGCGAPIKLSDFLSLPYIECRYCSSLFGKPKSTMSGRSSSALYTNTIGSTAAFTSYSYSTAATPTNFTYDIEFRHDR